MADYHVPVLGQEVCDKLITDLSGNYLDGTLGGGGHAELILNKLNPDAVYIGVDRDAEALAFAKKRLNRFPNLVLYQGLFSEQQAAMKAARVEGLDGILLDLGVSSHQIDELARGFAFRPGAALDMRMNATDALTAADILADYPLERLVEIFKNYGEERHAARIAREVVKVREAEELLTSVQLMAVIERCVPGKFLTKSFARIFQALRIEVNQELAVLQDALDNAIKSLKPGGRLAVISYHSLEDRITKNFLSEQENPCTCPAEIPYCVCGKKPQIKRVKPKFIVAGQEEVKNNPRARSAKLRIGEKL